MKLGCKVIINDANVSSKDRSVEPMGVFFRSSLEVFKSNLRTWKTLFQIFNGFQVIAILT